MLEGLFLGNYAELFLIVAPKSLPIRSGFFL